MMKTILKSLFLLPALLLAAACSSDADFLPQLPTEADNPNAIIAQASMPGGDTRLTFTEDGTTLSVKWKASGESFKVATAAGELFSLLFKQMADANASSQEAVESASFELDASTGSITNDATCYALYPAPQRTENDKPSAIELDLSNQSGESYDADALQTYMWAKATYKTGTPLNFNFQHLTAAMKVEIEVPNATSGTEVKDVTFTAGSGLVTRAYVVITGDAAIHRSHAPGTISLTGSFTTDENGKFTTYLRLLPTEENIPLSNLRVTFTVGGKSYTTELVKDELTIAAGKWYYTSNARTSAQGLHIATAGELGGTGGVMSKQEGAGDRIAAAITDAGSLKVTGFPNNNDFQVIRDWAKAQQNNSQTPTLVTLDLTDLDASVKEVGNEAFKGVTTLTTVNLPATITKIGEDAFSGCTELATIDLTNVTTFGANAFIQCALTAVDLTNVTSVGGAAFQSCTNLTTVTLKEDGTFPATFPSGSSTAAFKNCSKLTTVENLENATKIPAYAFDNCEGLTSVNLSAAETIGKGAFNLCTSLATVTFNSSKLPTTTADNAASAPFKGCSSLETVSLSAYTTIPAYLFAQSGLTSVDLSKATSIGNSAFYGTGLTSADLSAATSIGQSAFLMCEALESVTFHENGVTLGTYVFQHCTALTMVTNIDKLETIPQGAFQYCDKLTEVNLSVAETIGQSAFSGCDELKTVTLKDGGVELGMYTFRGCTALTTIHNIEDVGTIPDYTFDGCTSLVSINLASATNLGNKIFNGCTKLTTIKLGQTKFTSVSTQVFDGFVNKDDITAENNYAKNATLYLYDDSEGSTVVWEGGKAKTWTPAKFESGTSTNIDISGFGTVKVNATIDEGNTPPEFEGENMG